GLCPGPGNGSDNGSHDCRIYIPATPHIQVDQSMKTRQFNFWGWFWAAAAALYFFLPMYGTLDFSLRMKKGVISLLAYQTVLADPQFLESFRYSAIMGLITVIISVLLFVPTVYWIYLRLPQARPIVEIITILPFIIPVIVYVFGLIRTFGKPPFQL